MGMFDTFAVDDCDGQVKIYDRVMADFKVGDIVPDSLPEKTYAIGLRYGCFAIIHNLMFVAYTKEKPNIKVYDKWGGDWVSHEVNYGKGE